jgi:endonuclease/exonuclease/phosphatase family metal-dependent hydrolase
MAKKSRIRILAKKSLLVINILTCFLFLYPLFITPLPLIWINGFLGLIAPYLIALNIVFFIFWLIAKPLLSLVSLISLLLGWKILFVLLAWHPGTSFSEKKKENTLRIMSWNVKGFNGVEKNSPIKMRTEDIAYSILKWDPDIICMQEYNTNERPNDIANHANYFNKKYPHSFFSKDYSTPYNDYFLGCIIYSKYKIIHAERIAYTNKESLIYATILKGDDTIRVYTTHLASYRLQHDDFEAIDDSTPTKKSDLKAKWTVIRKMKHAFVERAVQAELVRKHIITSPYPTIITGDFNDVPSSYTYRTIKGDWQDAFLQKGLGIGATYTDLSPTLRIDYILTNASWEVRGWESVDENLSDHHMIMADLLLKK